MLRKWISCTARVLIVLLLPNLAGADVLPVPIAVTASSEFAAQYAVTNLFDATVTNADVGNTLYGNPDGQWAGVGAGPFNVFMDFGSSLTGVDGFAYSQRLGATPTTDKVGKVDLWFSNTNFDGVLPATPADASVTVTNVTTRLFTQYSFGQNEFSGRYVAARFSAPTGGGGNIGGSEFRLTTNTPGATNPELIINRATGNIRLTNDTPAPVNFIAYEIVSAAGGLNAGSWTSIASNYDAGSPGPNQVDPTDNWIKFTTGTTVGTTLGEGEQPGGNGVTLGVGKSIDLGNSWLRTPYEDLELRLLKDDGSLHTTVVRYTGNEIVLGDLNNNGTVGPEDWPLFRAGLGSIGTGLTLAQTYGKGDLDGDFDTDLVDFRQFEAIYDAANGGAGALQTLIGANVPEPSSLGLLFSLLALGMCPRRAMSAIGHIVTLRHRVRGLGLSVAVSAIALVQTANAQVFTLANPAVPTAATANSEFGGEFVVGKLFDDAVTAAELGVKSYTPETTTDYAGVGPEPKNVFMDYGQSISANYLAFAQRLGGDFLADKVGTIDLWFSNTDFANTLPATQPNKTINVTDLSLDGSATLTPYSLGGVFSGRYVAARLTISDVSAVRPVNNLGGSELRLAMGPSDVILEVNRTNGSMTIRNQGVFAQALAINGYEITSTEGSLLNTWAGFENGNVAGFPAGNGSGNGWEKGDSSNANSLSEARLVGDSTIGANQVIGLGTGYSSGVDSQDLSFRFSITGGNGLMLPGVVQYVGGPPTLFGDYNQNGRVDAADYTVWRDKLGAASLPNENPAQSPGIVDSADYQVWKSNFGQGTGGAAATAVPEPTALAITLVTVCGWALITSRRASQGTFAIAVMAVAVITWVASTREAIAATPDAVYLFGDNSELSENGAPNVEVGQGAGADIPGFTYDDFGNSIVLTTFRDLAPGPDTAGQRPIYVNTATLQYPGSTFGSGTTGIGIQFDGVNDHLRGPGLGYPQDGDNAFTDAFADAYFTLTTRLMEGWVRPTNLNGTRQDVVNDTYQFGIHITSNNTWGINFGSTNGTVDTVTFDSGVTLASTLDANGWAHVEHRTFDAAAAALYVNGKLVIRTPNGAPFYHGAAVSATANDLSLVFGANLAGDANFFKGQLDNFRLLIAGDNRGLTTNGMNYGRVDLSIDNDYIASNVIRGDANGDGIVNGNGTGPAASDDVTFFVNHYGQRQFVNDTNGNSVVAGDITSVTTMADLDGSGQTDIFDWYILTQAHIDSSGIGSIDIGALLSNRGVPEPSSAMLIAIALATLAFKQRSRA